MLGRDPALLRAHLLLTCISQSRFLFGSQASTHQKARTLADPRNHTLPRHSSGSNRPY